MLYATHKVIVNQLAKADALYYAIGMVVTILELALIATNKDFGAASLEVSFLIQVLFSVMIESSAGIFFLKKGPYLTTKNGILFKILAAFLLGCAVTSSSYLNSTVTWAFLLVFFMADGVGSGCLLSAFRPAYAQWFAEKMHHQYEADFLKIFKLKMTIRIGLPLIILLFSVLFFYITQEISSLKDKYYFYSSIIIVGVMLFVRVYQLKVTINDFKNTNLKSAKIISRERVAYTTFMGSLNKVKVPLFFYIVGNMSYLTVMMYTIGLSFKLTTQFQVPFYLSWLGGSVIGFIIYLVSSLFGYFIYPRLAETFDKRRVAFCVFILVIAAVLCDITFYMHIINYQVTALLGFSLISVIVGNGLLRLMTNRIIHNVPASNQQAIFILGETITSLIIALCIFLSLYSSSDNATIVSLLSFILLVGCISIVMSIYQPVTGVAQEVNKYKTELT